MLEYRGKLIQGPAECIHGEACFQGPEPTWATLSHDAKIQREKDHERHDVEYVPRPWHHEAVLVEHRPFARVVERDGLVFVVIRDNVNIARGRISDPPFVDGVYTFTMLIVCHVSVLRETYTF